MGPGVTTPTHAVEVSELSHWYGSRQALSDVGFHIEPGELFGVVGPNGGGKSTLFQILSTFIKPSRGCVSIFGEDAVRSPERVRPGIGVVFQSPGLDKKLTAEENLWAQGSLYGLSGKALKVQVERSLVRMGLWDRRAERIEKLSGGLKRRVEIAKGMLQEPALLLLDEPTTGLDPLIRREIWDHVRQLRETTGLTVLLTTHLLEEAELCQRIAFIHEGRIVAMGTPQSLKEALGGEIITIRSPEAETLRGLIEREFSVKPRLDDGEIRWEQPEGHEWISKLMLTFGSRISSVTLGKPTLEDLFIQKTGRRILEGTSFHEKS
jgi:ABC-2 type transport system ATP-binding protein